MAKSNNPIYALNAGEISRYAMMRVDLAKMRLAAAQMVNWVPKVLGPMQFRPGTIYRAITNGNKRARVLPFIFSATDTAQLELTDLTLRPLIDGQPISRVAVSTVVADGGFATGVGWTFTASTGATAAVSGGQLSLDAIVRGSKASARQQVTVAGGDVGKEHGIRVVVDRGPVFFRVGTTNGGDEYLSETELQDGTHSLAVTPAGNFWVQFSAEGKADRRITSIAIESAGIVTLPTPWTEAQLRQVRFDQSADVIFCDHSSSYPRRIERRGAHSWSIVRHPINDGPFGVGRSARVQLKVGATEGITMLTSDAPFFSTNHVGALFKLFNEGVKQTVNLGAENTWSEVLRVTGVNSENDFSVQRAGTWVGTLRLQRSVDGPESGFADVGPTYPAAGTTAVSPGTEMDNVIAYYRVGFRPGDYTSGVAAVTLSYSAGGSNNTPAAGSATGVCRVIGYTSTTQVTVEVIKPFGNTVYTSDWNESIWSDRRGWPSAAGLHEGRIWEGNSDKITGSVSDAFNSFDDSVEGDSGPIVRSIATGPVNKALWILSLGRLVIGTSGAEAVPRSSSFDEPMTPTNFSIKDASTQGSADVQATKVDRNGIFVQRSGKRIYELAYDASAMDYASSDLTRFNPQIARPGIIELATQRQPDTRIWGVRSDGQCAILLYEKAEEVTGWYRFETDGVVESVCVTPNTDQDDVWLCVQRVINGVTNHYIERVSYDDNALGAAVNEVADCAVVYGAHAAALTGLNHLEGKQVVVWADGAPVEDKVYTVTGGGITLPAAVVTGAVVGLGYEGRWQSTKLAYSAELGTAVSQKKRVDGIGVVMADTLWRGPRFGGSFDGIMDPVPARLDGRILSANEVLVDYDAPMFPIPGDWSTDSRVCIRCQAPYPATILGLVIGIGTHDKG